jgi:hypothetical protein
VLEEDLMGMSSFGIIPRDPKYNTDKTHYETLLFLVQAGYLTFKRCKGDTVGDLVLYEPNKESELSMAYLREAVPDLQNISLDLNNNKIKDAYEALVSEVNYVLETEKLSEAGFESALTSITRFYNECAGTSIHVQPLADNGTRVEKKPGRPPASDLLMTTGGQAHMMELKVVDSHPETAHAEARGDLLKKHPFLTDPALVELTRDKTMRYWSVVAERKGSDISKVGNISVVEHHLFVPIIEC